MSDDHYEMPVRITGELRPPFVIAMETAMEMCKEAGWTVETVIIHKFTPKGLCMWKLDGKSGEDSPA
ncbi:hypothetical protein [Streptomyces spinosus]|uniref:hypothetical protein n=1 Tax=Streptomyces spinosus TaxID=2872623 RepID=UPI001CEC0240|nr:hypothetical protein [Streptomyces spinosus]